MKFKVAFEGLLVAIRHKSVLIQFVLALITLIVCFILKLELLEFVTILLCIGMVIVSEILNTCIELLCDLYSTSYDKRIKKIKDISAGAVLFASIISLIIGSMIFITHIL